MNADYYLSLCLVSEIYKFKCFRLVKRISMTLYSNIYDSNMTFWTFWRCLYVKKCSKCFILSSNDLVSKKVSKTPPPPPPQPGI